MALDSSSFKKMFGDASGARKSVEARWEENYNLWVGKHWTAEELKEVRSPVVVPFTQGKILFLLAQVAESPPTWKVTPVERSDQAAADLWEPLMPMIWRRARMGRKVRHLTQDALIYGVGILKPYWDETMLGGIGDINVGVIDPQYFYPDPNAKDLYLEDAEYVILQYTVTQEYVRQRYGKLAKEYGRELPVLSRTGGTVAAPDYTFGDVDAAVSEYSLGRRLTLFDVVYNGGERIGTFLGTPGQAENVFDRPSPYAYLGVNFDFGLAVLPYIEETHEQWPHGLPEQTGSLNKYYDVSRAQVQESARYAANSFYTGVRTPELKEAQKKGGPKPGQMYLFDTAEDADKFKEHGGTPMIGAGVWQLLQLTKYEMDSVTQIFDETQGKRPAGITSGKALRELRETAAGRPRMFLGQLSECLVDTGQIIMALGQLHYDTDRIVRLQGPEGARWDIAHRDRLAGQFDLECSVKQSFALEEADMANLALVLQERGVIGALDLLRALHWPNPEEALARGMQDQQMLAAAAPSGGGGNTRPALNTEGHQRGGEVV